MRRCWQKTGLVALGVIGACLCVAGCHEYSGGAYVVEEDYPMVAGYPGDEVIIERDGYRHGWGFDDRHHREDFHHEGFRREGRHEERHEEHHEAHHGGHRR